MTCSRETEDTEQRPREDGGRDWGDVATATGGGNQWTLPRAPGGARPASSHQERVHKAWGARSAGLKRQGLKRCTTESATQKSKINGCSFSPGKQAKEA